MNEETIIADAGALIYITWGDSQDEHVHGHYVVLRDICLKEWTEAAEHHPEGWARAERLIQLGKIAEVRVQKFGPGAWDFELRDQV